MADIALRGKRGTVLLTEMERGGVRVEVKVFFVFLPSHSWPAPESTAWFGGASFSINKIYTIALSAARTSAPVTIGRDVQSLDTPADGGHGNFAAAAQDFALNYY